jgi:crotonobetainyl-CoA:carnitine CoA-transferase CaiB-like acyl-CoA transferase
VVPPWRFGGRTPGVERPAPLLGADTAEVLAALNASAGTVEKAASAG